MPHRAGRSGGRWSDTVAAPTLAGAPGGGGNVGADTGIPREKERTLLAQVAATIDRTGMLGPARSAA